MYIIAGLYKGRLLKQPSAETTRPTAQRTREGLFNVLTHLPGFQWPGVTVLDAFAGSGALGLEALSRGASDATFFEKNSAAYRVLRGNIRTLGCDKKAHCLKQDSFLPPRAKSSVDVVFLDPPYTEKKVFLCLQKLVQTGWINAETWIMLETSSKEEFSVPSLFLCDRYKIYGAARISFLKLNSEFIEG